MLSLRPLIACTAAAFLLAVPVSSAQDGASPSIELHAEWFRIVDPYRYVESRRFEAGWNRGADIDVLDGQVRAPVAGSIRFSGTVAGRRVVTIATRVGNRAIVVTVTGLDSVRVRVGERVTPGTVLGRGASVHIGAYDAARRTRYLPVVAASTPTTSWSLADGIANRLREAIEGRAGPSTVGLHAPLPTSERGLPPMTQPLPVRHAPAPPLLDAMRTIPTALASVVEPSIGISVELDSAALMRDPPPLHVRPHNLATARGSTYDVHVGWRETSGGARSHLHDTTTSTHLLRGVAPSRTRTDGGITPSGPRLDPQHPMGMPAVPGTRDPQLHASEAAGVADDVRHAAPDSATIWRAPTWTFAPAIASLILVALAALRHRRRSTSTPITMIRTPFAATVPLPRAEPMSLVHTDGASIVPRRALAWSDEHRGTSPTREPSPPERTDARAPEHA